VEVEDLLPLAEVEVLSAAVQVEAQDKKLKQGGNYMGLFSKKSPCPICGGKISWILPAKIEEEHVCSDCYGKIDMDPEKSETSHYGSI
jgi:hypothetical protein